MAGRKLTEAALAEQMLRYYGVTKMTRMLGVSVTAFLFGVNDRADFLAMPFGDRSSRYKWLGEFVDLAARLRADGFDLEDVPEDMPLGIVPLALQGG